MLGAATRAVVGDHMPGLLALRPLPRETLLTPDWRGGAAMSDAEPSSVPPVPISEHSRVLSAMHKAMRADSERLIRAVDALPAGDTQEAAALGRAFAAIVGLIHDHHWTEDDVMYPFLLQRVRTFEGDAIRDRKSVV